jgi:hypothetical protein
MTPRRFPPPWTVEEHNQACFIVKDASGQALGYFYFEDEQGRRENAPRRRETSGRVSRGTGRPSSGGPRQDPSTAISEAQ